MDLQSDRLPTALCSPGMLDTSNLICKFKERWASTLENLSSGFANNKGADYSCRLISAFVIRFSESILSKLAAGEISILQLVSVAEETGLSLALSETQKTGFVPTRPRLF